MENFKNEFYDPEHNAEFNGFADEFVDTMDSEFTEFDDYDDEFAGYEDGESSSEYDDFDDDDENFYGDEDDEDGEIFGTIAGLAGAALPGIATAAIPAITSGIGAAINGVSNVLRRGSSSRGKSRRLSSRRYTAGGPRVARNIATAIRSNLFGKIKTRSGRSVSFRLPPNVATKRDVGTLRKGIRTNAKAIRSNTKGVKANAKSIISTSRRVSSLDKKHTAASRTQNRILSSLNRRVRKVKSDLDKAQEQQRMMQMFQFMMPPEIENVNFENAPTVGDNDNVKIEYKTNLLPLMMSMGSGEGGGMGDMMNNPMMMLVMMQAFNNED